MDSDKLSSFNPSTNVQSATKQAFFNTLFSLKSSLGLINPGTFENLHKEARETFTTSYLINGARFDLTKGFSENFQINHSYSLAKNSQYTFIGLLAKGPWFLQGNIDGDGTLVTRMNYEHSKNLKLKTQTQITNSSEPPMIQLEAEYTAPDSTLNFKTVNYNPLEQTGIVCVNYLQSLTKTLSIGIEALFQRPNKMIEDSVLGYVFKYESENNGIFNFQYQPGVLQSSYFRKVSESTQLASELQLVSMNMKSDINVGVGAKFSFRESTLRTMFDTSGKVSTVLENRIAPPLTFSISGELNHKTGQNKFGFGVMFAV